MSQSKIFFGCGVIHLIFVSVCATESMVADLYRKVSDGLITIKRDFPAAQPKIYALLDQVEKMYAAAKDAIAKTDQIKKQLDEKAAESGALKTKLAQMSQEATQARKLLADNKNELEQKLSQEKMRVDQLVQEHKTVLAKLKEQENKPKHPRKQLASKDPAQPSLSLISTSDPNSPR